MRIAATVLLLIACSVSRAAEQPPATTTTSTRASLVTLHFKDAPARKVYESLYEQAGAKLKFGPADLFERLPTARVTIDVDKVPFWRAMDVLEEQTGLKALRGSQGMTLAYDFMQDVMQQREKIFISEAFKVIAEDRGGGIDKLTVLVEPRIWVLDYAMTPEIDGVENDGPGMGMRSRITFGGNVLDVHIYGDVRPAKLRGTVLATIAGRVEKLEIEDIDKANNVERKVDGMPFILSTTKPSPGNWVITLVVHKNNPTASIMPLEATFADALGNELSPPGCGASGGAKRITYDWRFEQKAGSGEPKKMILRVPVTTEEIRIPFEFPRSPDRLLTPN